VGHAALMSLEGRDTTFVTYKRKKIRNDSHSKPESEEGEKSNMGDMDEQPEGSTMNNLNDLLRGQQQLVHLMMQLLINYQGNQNNVGNNGASGSGGHTDNHMKGSNTHIPVQSNISIASRVTP